MIAERDVPPNDVIRLPRTGRAWRALLLLAVSALFVAGTWVGQDDWWPFSPWRMFSTSTSPSGSVTAMRIDVLIGDDPTWRPAPLAPSAVGLNRAEVEGRIPQITSNPAMLGTLARSHSQLRPDEPAWRAVRVVKHEVLLQNRAPTGAVRDTTLAQWSAP